MDFSSLGLPTNFGQRKSASDSSEGVNERLKKAERSQYKQWKAKQAQDTSSGSDSSDDEDDFNFDDIPVSHELLISGGHTQNVSSISIDPFGTRMITSSYDTDLNFWDFNSMDIVNLSPFRSISPMETIQLRSATFSPDGSNILVIPRHKQPLLYTRNGEKISEYAAGDMYLVDMKKTKGHIAEITSGAWEPVSDNPRFVTASNDSTVRLWDVQNTRSQKEVIVLRSEGMRGEKVKVTTVSWTDNICGSTSSMIIAGSSTGSVAFWDSKGPFSRPSGFIKDVDASGGSVTTLAALPSKQQLATRGMDGFVKLWDTRNLKSPILSRSGLKSTSEDGGGLVFDPRNESLGAYLLVGTDEGKIHVLDTSDLQTFTTLGLYEEGVSSNEKEGISSLYWCKKLNQIVAGTTSGNLKIFFSPETSTKGANLIFEKIPKRKHIDDNSNLTVSISAVGLEEGIKDDREIQQARRQQRKLQQQREREGETAIKSTGQIQPTRMDALQHKKTMELSERQAAQTEFVHMNMGDSISEDSREALLKYANAAKAKRNIESTGFSSYQDHKKPKNQ